MYNNFKFFILLVPPFWPQHYRKPYACWSTESSWHWPQCAMAFPFHILTRQKVLSWNLAATSPNASKDHYRDRNSFSFCHRGQIQQQEKQENQLLPFVAFNGASLSEVLGSVWCCFSGAGISCFSSFTCSNGCFTWSWLSWPANLKTTTALN